MRTRLLLEAHLVAERGRIYLHEPTVRVETVPARLIDGLGPAPRGARAAVLVSLRWAEILLNGCERFPFTCAEPPKGEKPRKRLCPACAIRKALGMAPLRRKGRKG